MNNIFKISKDNMSLIKNEDILNYDYVPKLLPYREGQIQEIANSIKPMLNGLKGNNLFIYGAPGIGKTASIKWVLRELEDVTDEIIPLYVNCWNLKTKYFIFSEMAKQLKLVFTQGKSAEHILQIIENKLKDKNSVFVFDEVDKAENSDFLYQIVSLFPKSSILLVSNAFDYVAKMDSRIRSRLMVRNLEFKPYNQNEILGILNERVKLAIKSGVIPLDLIKRIAFEVYNRNGDLRIGLFIIRELVKSAEEEGLEKVKVEDLDLILEEIKGSIIEEGQLNSEEERIVESVKEKNGGISGEIYEIYKSKGGKLSYRSFKRYIDNLERLNILRTEETRAGFKGKSTFIFIN